MVSSKLNHNDAFNINLGRIKIQTTTLELWSRQVNKLGQIGMASLSDQFPHDRSVVSILTSASHLICLLTAHKWALLEYTPQDQSNSKGTVRTQDH